MSETDILKKLDALADRISTLEKMEHKHLKLYYQDSQAIEYLAVTAGALVVNDDSNDVDFRVESNANANMLVVDAALDAVGIGGAAAAGFELKVTGDTWATGDSLVDGFFRLGTATELTINTGVVTAVRSFHTVDTQADAATDDLDTINGGVIGAILILRAAHTDRTVVVKDGTGNLFLAGDMSLDSTIDLITLFCVDGTNWVELCRSAN